MMLLFCFVDDQKALGIDSRLNEPWSGLEGFMHSVESHAKKLENSRTQSLMIEVRQDLILDTQWRHKLVESLYQSLKKNGFC